MLYEQCFSLNVYPSHLNFARFTLLATPHVSIACARARAPEGLLYHFQHELMILTVFKVLVVTVVSRQASSSGMRSMDLAARD